MKRFSMILTVVIVAAVSFSYGQKTVKDRDLLPGMVATAGIEPHVFDGGKNDMGICQIVATCDASGKMNSPPVLMFHRPEKTKTGGVAWGTPFMIGYTEDGPMMTWTNKAGKKVVLDLEKLAAGQKK